MGEGSSLFLASKVVCIDEVKNPDAMEVEGIHRCLDEVEAHAVVIEGLATDRHVQATRYMKKLRLNIDHQYENFHAANGITKELSRTCRSRGTDDVWKWSVSECYQSLTAHQHQKGHTVPKQVITIPTSIQVATI